MLGEKFEVLANLADNFIIDISLFENNTFDQLK